VSAISDAVIPVGGPGTRLLPATRSQHKELLPIVDKPVVQYVVEELVRAGIARVRTALRDIGCGVLAPTGEQEG
jgi:UTP--glucose-1-phosphate uridylyltransferase